MRQQKHPPDLSYFIEKEVLKNTQIYILKSFPLPHFFPIEEFPRVPSAMVHHHGRSPRLASQRECRVSGAGDLLPF